MMVIVVEPICIVNKLGRVLNVSARTLVFSVTSHDRPAMAVFVASLPGDDYEQVKMVSSRP